MKDEEVLQQHKLYMELRRDVARLVIGYTEKGLLPESIACCFLLAGTKVSSAYSAAIIEAAKKEERESEGGIFS